MAKGAARSAAFFFQAEDGIRDHCVTGVQTCALPICSLAWNAEDPNTLWIGRREKANESLIKDPSLLSPEARGYAAYPGGHTEGYPDTFVQLFKDFYAYLDAGDFKAPRSFPTFSTGHDQLILCETIAQSAQKRAWLEIPWD